MAVEIGPSENCVPRVVSIPHMSLTSFGHVFAGPPATLPTSTEAMVLFILVMTCTCRLDGVTSFVIVRLAGGPVLSEGHCTSF